MIFRIPANKHRARPLRPWLYWNQRSFAWLVKFTEGCRHDLQSDDQYDYNKLIGIGYLWHHHKDSARFGWRYNKVTDMIEIAAYCYVNGRRVITPFCSCDIGKPYRIELRKLATMYFFSCYEAINGGFKTNGSSEVPYDHNKKLGYRLGVYFGGNQVAPHEMKIEITKV